jgi:hypothetical protein
LAVITWPKLARAPSSWSGAVYSGPPGWRRAWYRGRSHPLRLVVQTISMQ